ncbi:MAG: serine/threonine protein kinase [Rhodanobacteraceae bacterium]|nr:serine/threonine protein kinase [Rhodanobacteraceae bacterium]
MSNRLSYQELFERFNELAVLPAREQSAALQALNLHDDDYKRLLQMLAADQRTGPGFLDQPLLQYAEQLNVDAEVVQPEALIGQQYGDFVLERLIGQGGMATVFKARRTGVDFDQVVALKILKRGLFSSLEQRLFQRERQVLAQLSHPNIAHLVDGGITPAGIPYLVMEYVEGIRLDAYVQQHRLGLRERIELFVRMARAVEAAHRMLVVHRDLKPSNILVTSGGVPKLLDFGIAKLLTDGDEILTRSITQVLTPGYAAPEQVAGAQITTATDVYALGVILYELLTGARPEGPVPLLASKQAARSAPSTTLAPPHTVTVMRRLLQGDLDSILAQALAASPELRYPSAGALIDDLQNYLHGLPIRAHPPSRWYRFRKFVTRHRALVTTSTALSLALVTALAAALWQNRQARLELRRADLTQKFLLDVMDTAQAELPPDQQPTPAQLAKQAALRLRDDSTVPPSLRADLLLALGRISFSNAAYEQAADYVQQALDIRTRVEGADHENTLEARILLLEIRDEQGKSAEVARDLKALIPVLRERRSKHLDEALGACSFSQMRIGEVEPALACQRERIDLIRREQGMGQEFLIAQMQLADLLVHVDRHREAIALFESTLAAWRSASYSEEHSDYVRSQSTLAVAYHAVGEWQKAISMFKQVLLIKRKTLPGKHPALSSTLASLGMLQAQVMQYDDADRHLNEALMITRASLGEQHAQTVVRLSQLSTLNEQRNRPQEALEFAQSAVAICNQTVIEDALCAHANLSLTIAARGATPELALQASDRALALYRRQFSSRHPRIAAVLSQRALTLLQLDQLDAALQGADEATQMFSGLGISGTTADLIAHHARAKVLLALKRYDPAWSELHAAIGTWRSRFPEQKKQWLLMLYDQTRAEVGLGRIDDAKRTAQEALALQVDSSLIADEITAFLKSTAR